MLPKVRRLSTPEVQTVLRAGRPLRTEHLSAKFLPHTGVPRVSVVVSKKVARRAVARNKLRRTIYRALYPLQNHGYLLVFVQKILPPPLLPIYAVELKEILKKTIPHV